MQKAVHCNSTDPVTSPGLSARCTMMYHLVSVSSSHMGIGRQNTVVDTETMQGSREGGVNIYVIFITY